MDYDELTQKSVFVEQRESSITCPHHTCSSLATILQPPYKMRLHTKNFRHIYQGILILSSIKDLEYMSPLNCKCTHQSKEPFMLSLVELSEEQNIWSPKLLSLARNVKLNAIILDLKNA